MILKNILKFVDILKTTKNALKWLRLSRVNIYSVSRLLSCKFLTCKCLHIISAVLPLIYVRKLASFIELRLKLLVGNSYGKVGEKFSSTCDTKLKRETGMTRRQVASRSKLLVIWSEMKSNEEAYEVLSLNFLPVNKTKLSSFAYLSNFSPLFFITKLSFFSFTP